MIVTKEQNFVSAVIYFDDSSTGVMEFISKINQVLADNFKSFEIICVNDSKETQVTSEIKKFACAENGTLNLIHMSYHHGCEQGMQAGINFAIGDFVFEFDSTNMDFDPALLCEVYHKSLEGFDIVNAIPEGRSRSMSQIFYKLFNENANSNYELQTQRFRIISRRGINRVQSLNKTIPYRKAIYANFGLNMYFIYYKPTQQTKKKFKNDNEIELALNALILFTDIFYKISFYLSCFFLCSTVFVGLYTVYIFCSSQPIEGWATMMLFSAFSFFGVFSLFTIIIKYLTLITNLIFKKQQYLIRSIEKISN